MVDFKEKTNPLMVAVIAIYLAAELLCPRPFQGAGGSMRAGQGRGQGKGRICQVHRREERASRFI